MLLFAGIFQDVRLVTLKSNGEKYYPGDAVCIRPRNSPQQVERFISVLQSNNVAVDANSLLKISEMSADVPVPPHLQYEVTFRQLCEEYFDLSAVPRRHVFTLLAELTDSALEKEKCEEFAAAAGLNELHNYCNRPHRNIIEVLQDFPHATKHLSYDMLFEMIPSIRQREFSIASSWRTDKDQIEILVAVVKYKTKLVDERLGLCSNFLANLQVGDHLSVWIKRGSFHFPDKLEMPVIMIGPGTGLAPFRSFINECYQNGCANYEHLILFFGCRGVDSDFHCKDELLRFEQINALNLICAFSRDQDHKVYVQHRIKQNGSLVWNVLQNPKSLIFVAGNSKNMPKEVRDAFVNVCEQWGKLSTNEAENLILNMEKSGRYQIESWT